MRIFLFIYSILILAASVFSLVMVPRALRDLGHERQRLKEDLPDASFDRMLEAGYRINTMLVLAEILYYFLILRSLSSHTMLRYGAFALGLVHIAYLVTGRLEKRRLASGTTRTYSARLILWLSALTTLVEIAYLLIVSYVLIQMS